MGSTYRRTVLDEDSPEFDCVSRMFQKQGYFNRQFLLKITKIEKTTNIALMLKFNSKREKYQQMYGQVKVEFLFHGTKKVNIPDILDENLRVDFHGRNIGHRFGAGVSFSAFPYYASHYCDKSDSQMLLCAVLVSCICIVPEQKRGETFTKPPLIEGVYPPLRYDTTAKDEKMSVLVKFEDHTFFPAYIIHFDKIERQQPSPYDHPITSRISNMPSGGSSARQQQGRPSRTNALSSREELGQVWTSYTDHSRNGPNYPNFSSNGTSYPDHSRNGPNYPNFSSNGTSYPDHSRNGPNYPNFSSNGTSYPDHSRNGPNYPNFSSNGTSYTDHSRNGGESADRESPEKGGMIIFLIIIIHIGGLLWLWVSSLSAQRR